MYDIAVYITSNAILYLSFTTLALESPMNTSDSDENDALDLFSVIYLLATLFDGCH